MPTSLAAMNIAVFAVLAIVFYLAATMHIARGIS